MFAFLSEGFRAGLRLDGGLLLAAPVARFLDGLAFLLDLRAISFLLWLWMKPACLTVGLFVRRCYKNG
jgi:hypothetical protein